MVKAFFDRQAGEEPTGADVRVLADLKQIASCSAMAPVTARQQANGIGAIEPEIEITLNRAVAPTVSQGKQDLRNFRNNRSFRREFGKVSGLMTWIRRPDRISGRPEPPPAIL